MGMHVGLDLIDLVSRKFSPEEKVSSNSSSHFLHDLEIKPDIMLSR